MEDKLTAEGSSVQLEAAQLFGSCARMDLGSTYKSVGQQQHEIEVGQFDPASKIQLRCIT